MLQPADEREVAQAVADATGPLVIVGGGTRPVGRPVEGTALSIKGLRGVTLYEPGALTLVVQAGTPLAEVEALLAVENQRLPFEPADWRRMMGRTGDPTIGAVAAGNISGPRRIQAGAARDAMIGLRFVDGQGTILRNGGRVMKNVTGLDLVKLLAGSWGSLGVITEVAFKLLPRPETETTLALDGLAPARAVAAMSAALGSPYEVTGAAHLPQGGEGGAPVTLLRLEGFANSVAYRAQSLSQLLSDFGHARQVAGASDLWADIRDCAPFAGRAGDVWRISVKPSDAPDLAAGLGAEVFFDWGGGLIWALAPEGQDLRAKMGAVAGHATLIRASEQTRAAIAPFPPQPQALAAISDGLRRKFDPRGILNPAIMA